MKEKRIFLAPTDMLTIDVELMRKNYILLFCFFSILAMNFLLQTSPQHCVMVDTGPGCTNCYATFFRTTELAPF